MTGRDWQAFDAELRVRTPEIVAELLGEPSLHAGPEWRWGRKGSLAVVVAGAKAGMWFDHEAGTGGGLVDLVARTRGLSKREALDWTADRIGLAGDVGPRRRRANRATRPAADIPETLPRATPEPEHLKPAGTPTEPVAITPADAAAARATRIWAGGGLKAGYVDADPECSRSRRGVGHTLKRYGQIGPSREQPKPSIEGE